MKHEAKQYTVGKLIPKLIFKKSMLKLIMVTFDYVYQVFMPHFSEKCIKSLHLKFKCTL